ncbi:MAG: Uma2 family endonuclease [Deltaproteobacteria bacterium]|nr:Uma2 family endonuclease [Deltaproteobacteria bacterium]
MAALRRGAGGTGGRYGCGVAAPSTRDRGEKKAIYARNGVTEYWIIDVRARELTVFTLEGDRYDAGRGFGESERVSSRVLAGFECGVAELLP